MKWVFLVTTTRFVARGLSIITASHEVKKSRFVAHVAPAATWEAAASIIDRLSDDKARHNCYAWIGSDSARSSDDGEPSGTAGKPIREAIIGEGLEDVVVLVIRYKSSTAPQLGAGGLIRAYGTSARLALRDYRDTVPSVTKTTALTLQVPHADLGQLHALVASWGTRVRARVSEDYGPTAVELTLDVDADLADSLLEEARHRLGPQAQLHQRRR